MLPTKRRQDQKAKSNKKAYWRIPVGWTNHLVCRKGRFPKQSHSHQTTAALNLAGTSTRLHVLHTQKLHSRGKLVPHSMQQRNRTAEWVDTFNVALIYFGNKNSKTRKTDASRKASHTAAHPGPPATHPAQLFLKTLPQ